MVMGAHIQMTHAEWKSEATKRFGHDPLDWKFVCPSCGHVAAVRDWKDSGATEGEVAFSCIGRHSTDPDSARRAAFQGSGGPCDYAGGGLFRLNPVTVTMDGGKELSVFAFADGVQS